MRHFTFPLLLAAHCISGQFAHADSPSQPPRQVDVHFADLDLARIEGAAALYTRLRSAARQVCAPLDERPLKRGELFNACVADALSTAVAKVDQPLLSSYYHAKIDGRSAGHPQAAQRVVNVPSSSTGRGK